MKKNLLFIALFFSIILSGCLNYEKREVTLELTGEHSGKGKVKYINIMSQKDDGKDVSLKDFGELINDYLQGDAVPDDLDFLNNIKKDLYIEDGKLVGEMSFEFDSLSHFNIYRYDENSPWMLLLGSDMTSTEVLETNGDYGRINAPIIFWDKKTKKMSWKILNQEDMSEMVSMNDLFKDWKAKQ